MTRSPSSRWPPARSGVRWPGRGRGGANLGRRRRVEEPSAFPGEWRHVTERRSDGDPSTRRSDGDPSTRRSDSDPSARRPASRLPVATVSRLPRYLQALVDAAEADQATISSDELATAAGLNSSIVRKDVSYLGTAGTRGVGYAVGDLTTEISAILGISVDRPVVIVGIGNLGRALASYDGFSRRGFRTVALVDADPDLIGTEVGGHHVEPTDLLPDIVRDRGVHLAVLATPAAHTQAVADQLVAAGVTALLNFAPVRLDVPDHVTVRTVDLSTELQILSFYEQLGGSELPAATG
ncbi:MAG: redox-sensing transcriptional repressor Rex [Nitriliruptor sp.]